MAKRNGFRIVVLTLVGAATLVCLVFAGLLVRLAIKTFNTTDEQRIARTEQQDQINETFQQAFGDASSADDMQINVEIGDFAVPAVEGTSELPPDAGTAATESTEGSSPAPILASGSQTITLDIDAEGNASYEGQPLTEETLKMFLASLAGDENIVLDVHPACDPEMAGLWSLFCSEAGFTAITQRVAQQPR